MRVDVLPLVFDASVRQWTSSTESRHDNAASVSG